MGSCFLRIYLERLKVDTTAGVFICSVASDVTELSVREMKFCIHGYTHITLQEGEHMTEHTHRHKNNPTYYKPPHFAENCINITSIFSNSCLSHWSNLSRHIKPHQKNRCITSCLRGDRMYH